MQRLSQRPGLHDAILIDERGITDHSGALSCGFISWDRIKEVYLLKLHDDDYLCVVPEDQEAWYDGLTKGQKRLAKANMRVMVFAVPTVSSPEPESSEEEVVVPSTLVLSAIIDVTSRLVLVIESG